MVDIIYGDDDVGVASYFVLKLHKIKDLLKKNMFDISLQFLSISIVFFLLVNDFPNFWHPREGAGTAARRRGGGREGPGDARGGTGGRGRRPRERTTRGIL